MATRPPPLYFEKRGHAKSEMKEERVPVLLPPGFPENQIIPSSYPSAPSRLFIRPIAASRVLSREIVPLISYLFPPSPRRHAISCPPFCLDRRGCNDYAISRKKQFAKSYILCSFTNLMARFSGFFGSSPENVTIRSEFDIYRRRYGDGLHHINY